MKKFTHVIKGSLIPVTYDEYIRDEKSIRYNVKISEYKSGFEFVVSYDLQKKKVSVFDNEKFPIDEVKVLKEIADVVIEREYDFLKELE